MTLGPLEYLVVGFTGTKFDGSIAREIEKVVANGTIRLVDIVFVGKDPEGNSVILELDNTDDPRFASFAGLLGDRIGLLTPEDLDQVAEDLPADTAGMVMLFEHRWAVGVKEAIGAAGGFLIDRAVVPPEVLEEVQAELDALTA